MDIRIISCLGSWGGSLGLVERVVQVAKETVYDRSAYRHI